jgi:aspartyl protease family protein
MNTSTHTRSLGKKLLALAFCLLLNPALAPLAQAQEGAANAGTELVLHGDADNNFRFQGLINGHPVVFLVDTGASLVTIPGHLAAQLGLKQGEKVQMTTASEVYDSHRTNVKALNIGQMRLADVEGVINPKATDNEILLGMSALKKLEMVQKDGALILRATGALQAAMGEEDSEIQIKTHVRDCMGASKVIDAKTLACMKGA